MQTSRERILNNIRASLETKRGELMAMATSAPHTPPPFVHPPADDLSAQFVAELSKLEGRVYRCASNTEALDTVQRILAEHQATAVIAWDLAKIGLSGLAALLNQQGVTIADSQVAHTGAARAERLQALDTIPVCISGAEYGIAESGSIIVLSGEGQGRLASLLAPIHIAVLPAVRLVRGLGEALTAIQDMYGTNIFHQRSNLTIITGPSRTADIELTLTLGVHGPREIHVLLLETDAPAAERADPEPVEYAPTEAAVSDALPPDTPTAERADPEPAEYAPTEAAVNGDQTATDSDTQCGTDTAPQIEVLEHARASTNALPSGKRKVRGRKVK